VVETDQSNGINTVQSSVSFALGADQENLVLTGFEATTGTGNSLDNSIMGNRAANVLDGGDGNDTLVGGLGGDILTGGSGSDTFRFIDVGESSVMDSDRILDFVSGIDKIDLGGIDADLNLAGHQSFTFTGTAALNGTAGQLRHHSNGADTWLQADTDGDGIIDFEVVLAGVTVLSRDDFLL
jgi:Ca2+-binding RTX toxin-like protein